MDRIADTGIPLPEQQPLLVLGNGGGNHNFEFEGTLVKGDEIIGYNQFKMRLFAGYTSP